jgi:O-antigen/teichoic acid export membrane protein
MLKKARNKRHVPSGDLPVGSRRAAVQAAWAGQLGGLTRDTFWVALWQGATTIAELGQIALVTHLLGLSEYGRLALVVATVSLVGEFFGVRVGIATTTSAADKIGRDHQMAAGIFQLGYLIEGAGAVIGVLVLAAAAPFVGPSLIGVDGTLLLVVYALTLLPRAIERPSLAALRLLNRFRLITAFTSAMEGLRVGCVLVAVLVFHSLIAVVIALAIARITSGALTGAIAARIFRRASGGVGLMQAAIRHVGRADRRKMIKTVLHTNVIAYTKLAQFQLPTILLGAMIGATATAIYKIGMAAAVALGKLADPAAAALLPRLSRLWAAGRTPELRRLIEQATAISLPVMALGLVLLIVFRVPVLQALGGSAAASTAGTVLIVGAIAQALYGASFWRGTVLLAAHRAAAVAATSVVTALAQLLTLVILVPGLEAEGAAIAYLVNTALSTLVLTFLAVRTLRGAEARVRASQRTEPPAELEHA